MLSVIGADTNVFLPHHGIEALVKEMGFDTTMIRPSDFMQNLETVHLSGIVARNEIAVPAGRGRSSFIDVTDVGAVIARVLTSEGHSGKGYTITGPEALSFDDVARTLTEVLGRPIRYRKVGVLKFLAEHLRARLPLPLGLVMAALYSVQRFDQASLITGEVGRLLGRPPRTLREFVVRNSAVWGNAWPVVAGTWGLDRVFPTIDTLVSCPGDQVANMQGLPRSAPYGANVAAMEGDCDGKLTNYRSRNAYYANRA